MAAEASPQSLSTSGNFRRRLGDRTLRAITALAALVLAPVMVLLVYEVVDLARPSMSEFGLGFLTGTEWNAVTDKFGALDLIWGTLATSLIALLIAVPIAIAIALFLTELAPGVLRTPVGMMVELLAAIPSVVLGLWGIVVMGPFLNEHIEPWMISHLGFIPFLDGYPSPVGLLPACLILTIMIVPIVASISRELLPSVPSDLKQGAMALGATRWEMVRRVALPQVSGGLVAGTMLGFGRAVGEAIAVTQVIGGSLVRPRTCTRRLTPWPGGSPPSTRCRHGACRRLRWPIWRCSAGDQPDHQRVAHLIVRRMRRRRGRQVSAAGEVSLTASDAARSPPQADRAVMEGLATAAALLAIAVLVIVLISVAKQGPPALNLDFFTQIAAPFGEPAAASQMRSSARVIMS